HLVERSLPRRHAQAGLLLHLAGEAGQHVGVGVVDHTTGRAPVGVTSAALVAHEEQVAGEVGGLEERPGDAPLLHRPNGRLAIGISLIVISVIVPPTECSRYAISTAKRYPSPCTGSSARVRDRGAPGLRRRRGRTIPPWLGRRTDHRNATRTSRPPSRCPTHPRRCPPGRRSCSPSGASCWPASSAGSSDTAWGKSAPTAVAASSRSCGRWSARSSRPAAWASS